MEARIDPTGACLAVLLMSVRFQCTQQAKNQELPKSILNNPKSSLGQPCELPYDKYNFPQEAYAEDADANVREKYLAELPYVGSCSLENNEMCAFVSKKTPVMITTPEPTTAQPDSIDTTLPENVTTAKAKTRKPGKPAKPAPFPFPRNPGDLGQRNLRDIAEDNSLIETHHDYLNEVSPEDPPSKNLKKLTYRKNESTLIRKNEILDQDTTSYERNQFITSTQGAAFDFDGLALVKLVGQSTIPPTTDTIDSTTLPPQPAVLGKCKCGYRNEKDHDWKIPLEADENGICRGQIGFPCKSLYLGEGKEEFHGYDESCLSGICDQKADMCVSGLTVEEKESTSTATRVIKAPPSTTVWHYFGILWLAIIVSFYCYKK